MGTSMLCLPIFIFISFKKQINIALKIIRIDLKDKHTGTSYLYIYLLNHHHGSTHYN